MIDLFHVGVSRGARLVALALAVAPLSAAPARAQDDAALPPPPAETTTPPPRTDGARFDLDASLSSGDSPLTAAEAARLAVERSPRIAVADTSVDAAEAAVHRATAALVPRLDFSARYSHIDGFPDGMISTPAGTLTIRIPRDQFQFIARLTVAVTDTIFALLPALEGAEGRLRAEELRALAARRDVALQAEEAYYRYAEARGLLGVAEAGAALARERLAMIEANVEAGTLTPPDRIAAEAGVAQAEEGIARARQAVAVTGAALRVAIGGERGVSYAIAVHDGEDGSRPGSIDEAEVRALSERPEIQALHEMIDATRATRRATEASGYPHLNLYALGDLSNPSLRVFPQREEFFATYEIGAMITWSPNDLMTSIFTRDELSAQIAHAEAELEVLEDAIRLEIRTAWEALDAAREARAAADASVRAAEEAYAARAAQLAAGEAVVTDLTAADARVTEARLAALRARIEQSVAAARLSRALGEEPPGAD